MSSISAVRRDEAQKLADQQKVAKAMLFKKPFYPYFGKACKDFFSNQEFSILARYLDDRGKVHKEVIMQSDQACRMEANEIYSKLQHALQLGPFPQDYDIRKLLLELRTLNDAYGTYTTVTEYNYANRLDLNDEQDGVQKDLESALASFKRITMAQLLEQISKSKNELEKDFAMHQEMYNVETKQAEEKAQSAYPSMSKEGTRGMQQGDTSEYQGLINPAAPKKDQNEPLKNYLDNTKLWPWPLGDRSADIVDPEDEASSGVWI